MSIYDFLSASAFALALIGFRVSRRELKELNESLQHENRKMKNQIQQLEKRIVDLESNKQ